MLPAGAVEEVLEEGVEAEEAAETEVDVEAEVEEGVEEAEEEDVTEEDVEDRLVSGGPAREDCESGRISVTTLYASRLSPSPLGVLTSLAECVTGGAGAE